MILTQNKTFLRIASALIALPIYLYTIINDRFFEIPLLITSLVITLGCLSEFYKVTDRGKEGKGFMKWGLLGAVVINLFVYYLAFGKNYFCINPEALDRFSFQLGGFILTFFLIIVFIGQLAKNSIPGSLYSMAITVFGLIFIAFFFSHILLLKSLSNGVYYILMLNLLVMVNDSAAYFGGMFFGKNKINSPISPNKTWEGYLAGLFFGSGSLIISNYCFYLQKGERLFGSIEIVFLGLFLCLLANSGDLLESLIKRDSKIKDSGSIIPGHGGLWDVFDALILALPVFYYYLFFKGIS